MSAVKLNPELSLDKQVRILDLLIYATTPRKQIRYTLNCSGGSYSRGIIPKPEEDDLTKVNVVEIETQSTDLRLSGGESAKFNQLLALFAAYYIQNGLRLHEVFTNYSTSAEFELVCQNHGQSIFGTPYNTAKYRRIRPSNVSPQEHYLGYDHDRQFTKFLQHWTFVAKDPMHFLEFIDNVLPEHSSVHQFDGYVGFSLSDPEIGNYLIQALKTREKNKSGTYHPLRN